MAELLNPFDHFERTFTSPDVERILADVKEFNAMMRHDEGAFSDEEIGEIIQELDERWTELGLMGKHMEANGYAWFVDTPDSPAERQWYEELRCISQGFAGFKLEPYEYQGAMQQPTMIVHAVLKPVSPTMLARGLAVPDEFEYDYEKSDATSYLRRLEYFKPHLVSEINVHADESEDYADFVRRLRELSISLDIHSPGYPQLLQDTEYFLNSRRPPDQDFPYRITFRKGHMLAQSVTGELLPAITTGNMEDYFKIRGFALRTPFPEDQPDFGEDTPLVVPFLDVVRIARALTEPNVPLMLPLTRLETIEAMRPYFYP